MKKKICFIATLVMLLCLMVCMGMSVSAAEAEEFVEGLYTYTVTNGEATIVDVEDGIAGEVIIPENLGNYTVTSIGESAFEREAKISSVVIPDTVKTIDNYAFYGCFGIINIEFGNGLETIGTAAFKNCDGLINIRIPTSVKTIYNSAFSYCVNLSNVYISESVTAIYMYAFNDCFRLKGIWVDKNNSNYASDEKGVLFNKDRSKLCYYPVGRTDREYVVPETVETINNYAFNNSAYLEKIVCGTNVKTIKEMSFENCKKLNEIIFLGDVLQVIEANAFRNCISLPNISIPDSVTDIGDHAFDGCEKATSITIGKNVETIGFGAFWGCENVKNVHIPNNVVSMESSVFTDCLNLESITVDENNDYYTAENGVLFNKSKTQLVKYPPSKEDVSYKIPESVNSFEYYAFVQCKNIEEVILGANVTSLSSCLFQDCKKLRKVEFLGELKTINNSSFENCINLSDITIPESVTKIEFWAFRNCDSLKEINISKNVDEIGNYVFGNCDSLENILVDELNENYTSDENGVLYNKNKTILIQYPTGKKTTTYALADSVETIKENAFAENTVLETIILNNNLKEIRYDSFLNCESIKEIYIPAHVEFLDEYVFSGCTSLERITVDNNSEFYCDVDGVLFNKDKTQLICCPDSYEEKEYHIPDTVTMVMSDAFADVLYLEMIYIPSSVDTIYQEAFARCSSLQKIVVDESNVEYSSDENGVLFTYNKDTLIQYPNAKTDSMYIIPSSVEFGCSNLFDGNEYIKHIVLSPNMCDIDSGIFSGCKTLETVTILGNPTYIGIDAFLNCESLHSVYYSGSEYDWEMIDIGVRNEAVEKANKYYDIKWEYADGVLMFAGAGEVPPSTETTNHPWLEYADSTYEIILNGVTSVGKNAFADFSILRTVIIDGDSVNVKSGAFKNCEDLSLVVSYTNVNYDSNAIIGNIKPVKYFTESSKACNVPSVPFGFGELGAEVYGEATLTKDEFLSFMAAIYYGFESDFYTIHFNKLTADGFNIYKYTSLEPFEAEAVTEITNADVSIIIQLDENAYMQFSMRDFCEGMVDSGEEAEINYEIAVVSEEEKGFFETVREVLATWYEAIKKAISLIFKIFRK